MSRSGACSRREECGGPQNRCAGAIPGGGFDSRPPPLPERSPCGGPVQFLGSQSRLDHDRLSNVVLALGRDQSAHQRDQVAAEQRIERAVIDTPRVSMHYPDVYELGLLEFLDEVTLRQGPGHSPGPRRRVSQHFGRQGVLFDGEVRDAEASTGAKDACALRENAHLSRREIDHPV
jgi:hypothetical protein